jgi:hypothetical protein
MTTPAHNRPAAFDLSREEAWVLHAALADHLDRRLDDGEFPRYVRSLVLRVEAGDPTFDTADLRFLETVLEERLDGAPDRDREVAARLLAQVHETL